MSAPWPTGAGNRPSHTAFHPAHRLGLRSIAIRKSEANRSGNSRTSTDTSMMDTVWHQDHPLKPFESLTICKEGDAWSRLNEAIE
mmetsp:Transcript_632/g.1785  ORF Transcript_632/g.1785 Transcript_632/m.1785 type:complete len:85 (+) Transcript_632:439-693(+)